MHLSVTGAIICGRCPANEWTGPSAQRFAMHTSDLLAFLRQHRLAVQASVSPNDWPQAAVVGFAVTDRLEIVFDTLNSTRKVHNLRQNPRLALVIGGLGPGDERTAQYEGIADEPSGAELDRLKSVYYQAYPDGRDRAAWPGLIYVRVRPTWIRYSDYNVSPPLVVEFDAEQLTASAVVNRNGPDPSEEGDKQTVR